MGLLGPTGVDLSEQQQVICNEDMNGCSGGNSLSILFWAERGPLDEAWFPLSSGWVLLPD
jgi:hypothetical protein